MFRIPPSERVKQAINNLLQTGIYTNEGITSLLVRLGAQRLIQELLEQEVTDFLGRERYERKPEDQPNGGLRNGYKTRHIDCAEGRIPVELPQVRNTEEPYRSRLMEFLLGNSDVLEKLVVEMYARGLS
ncbi:MAG: transposase, partial [Bacillota bacterium]|nr:transposase [Bacillota bacterium]